MTRFVLLRAGVLGHSRGQSGTCFGSAPGIARSPAEMPGRRPLRDESATSARFLSGASRFRPQAVVAGPVL